jgi:hypothetical protein
MIFKDIKENYMSNCRLTESTPPVYKNKREELSSKTYVPTWILDFQSHTSERDLEGSPRRVTIPKDKAGKAILAYFNDLIELSQTQTKPFWFSNKL